MLVNQHWPFSCAGPSALAFQLCWPISIGLSVVLVHQHWPFSFAGPSALAFQLCWPISIGLSVVLVHQHWPFSRDWSINIGLSVVLAHWHCNSNISFAAVHEMNTHIMMWCYYFFCVVLSSINIEYMVH